MTLALAFYAPVAWACECEHVEIDIEGIDVEVLDCDHDHVEVFEYAPEPPQVVMEVEDEDRGFGQSLSLQYGMQFLPRLPGHNLAARLVGGKDAYLSAELRYTPVSEVVWSSRLGAGFDVFGRSDWDLTLGLWVGGAGEWDRSEKAAVMRGAPIAGGEVAFGLEGDRLFGKYRHIAGFGGGPVDQLLTENELTFGYKIVPAFHVYGQFLRLAPGEAERNSGVGLGARVAF